MQWILAAASLFFASPVAPQPALSSPGIAPELCPLARTNPQSPEASGSSTSEPLAVPSASRLFVSSKDGLLQCVELVGGSPAQALASIDLKEPLRFLAHDPRRSIVYALGDKHLMAVEWDSTAGAFKELGRAEAGLRGTHVALDPAARWALVASYGGGEISCVPLSPEGVPQAAVSRMGGGDDPRLTKAHQVQWHPDGQFAYIPALGADQVAIIRVDATSGALEWTGAAKVPEGTGPRHMALHPTQPWAYVLGEHTSTISAFCVKDAGAQWTPLGTTSNLPEGYTAKFKEPGSRSSDIHISADGRFLFAVNREPLNDLTSFAIDDAGGLRELSRVSTGGVHARTFALDPAGSRLWVGNTKSKDVVARNISPSGELSAGTGTWEAPAQITCVLAR